MFNTAKVTHLLDLIFTNKKITKSKQNQNIKSNQN